MKTSICSNWEFTPQWNEEFMHFQGEGEAVELPHNPVDLPLHYADHEAYQLVCGYRRKLELPADIAGKRYFLQFDGAAHIASVFVNGIAARRASLRLHRLPAGHYGAGEARGE